MRWLFSLPVVAVALTVTAQPDRPEDLLKHAVQAAGGAEVLTKYPAGRVVGKGTMTFAGIETAFTCEQSYQVPDKLRTVVRCEVKGRKWELIQVLNGDKATQTLNGRASPVTEVGLKELQFAVLLNEVAQLAPLAKESKFALKPDKQVKGGLLVQVRGFPELRLGFDRKTGHLVRIAYKATDPDSAKEAETEMIFSEFKAVSGLTRPTRCLVTRGGKTSLDLMIEKFTPLERIDPAVFTAPE
jgi:hypothetical protein